MAALLAVHTGPAWRPSRRALPELRRPADCARPPPRRAAQAPSSAALALASAAAAGGAALRRRRPSGRPGLARVAARVSADATDDELAAFMQGAGLEDFGDLDLEGLEDADLSSLGLEGLEDLEGFEGIESLEDLEDLLEAMEDGMNDEALEGLLEDFGQANEEVEQDPADPGRASVMEEFLGRGERVFHEASQCGQGYVVVFRHAASESADLPAACLADGSEWRQEWRTLQFMPELDQKVSPEDKEFVQSVAKVAVPEGSEGAGKPVMIGSVLALGYAKSMVSVALCAAHASGSSWLRRPADRPSRALVIGLGGGSISAWLADRFPGLVCDSVELDGAVAQVAIEAMGLPADSVTSEGGAAACAAAALREDGGRHRVHVCDGAAFVEELAAAAPQGFGYDVVVLDCAVPRLPPPFVEAPFLSGLKALMKPSAGLAINLPLSGSGPAYASAVTSMFQEVTGGAAFSVRTPILEGSNVILGFSTSAIGGDLKEQLLQSADSVRASADVKFSLARRIGVSFVEGELVA